jgi:phosphoglycerate kinase
MGESLFEKDYLDKARELVKNAEDKGCKMLLPIDFVCDDETMAVLDIGPDTVKQYAEIISRAHTIIWNGPMGYYEDPRYRAGSDLLFSAIAANHTALSIIGGGDTLLILENKSEEEKSHISHISTGGGAMLEFIENGTLPGIEAILDAQQHESAQ